MVRTDIVPDRRSEDDESFSELPLVIISYRLDFPLDPDRFMKMLQSFDLSFDMTDIRIDLIDAEADRNVSMTADHDRNLSVKLDCGMKWDTFTDFSKYVNTASLMEELTGIDSVTFDLAVDHVAGYRFVIHRDGSMMLLYNAAIPFPYCFDPYIEVLENKLRTNR